jgi:hypothetical protein
MTIRDVTVTWANSEFTGAPVLRGESGSLIELLDAVLIHGFCVRAFDAVSVADGVATLTMSAGNPYVQHGVIEIRDCAQPALNRKWRIDTSAASSITFTVDDLVPAGSHAGSGATVRYAPAGWEKPFADLGTYRAAYRSASLASTQMLLYVNDSDARYARVRGYESMTDIDTPGVPFPTIAQAALTNYTWAKSYTAGTAQVRPWAIASDDMFLQLFVAFVTSFGFEGRHAGYRFGDIAQFSPADAYHCSIAAHATAYPVHPSASLSSVAPISTAGCYFARALSGSAGAISAAPAAAYFSGGAGASPASLDGRLSLFPLLISTSTRVDDPLRGRIPGLLIGYEKNSDIQAYATLDDPLSMLVKVGTNTTNYDGWVALEIEGPWR